MKPARFQYARPRSLGEAVDLLARHGSDAAILAGGQSLMPVLNLRMAQPAILIDINAIAGLDGITRDGDRIVIGGRTRHHDIMASPLLREAGSLLVHAMPFVAHAAIRNRGTLGGSLALADPAAEMPACAVCLDAEIVALSTRGERVIPASDFFRDLFTTALAPDELICRVSYPVLDASWRVSFDEVARRRGDFAMAALALAVQVTDGRITACRIAFAGVESHPRRLTDVEAAVVGQGAEAAVALLAQSLLPLDGGDDPPAYRLQLARTLLARSLRKVQS